jgi:hypothetical protein
MKKKLSLSSLKVQSFVTEINSLTILGGADTEAGCYISQNGGCVSDEAKYCSQNGGCGPSQVEQYEVLQ